MSYQNGRQYQGNPNSYNNGGYGGQQPQPSSEGMNKTYGADYNNYGKKDMQYGEEKPPNACQVCCACCLMCAMCCCGICCAPCLVGCAACCGVDLEQQQQNGQLAKQ